MYLGLIYTWFVTTEIFKSVNLQVVFQSCLIDGLRSSLVQLCHVIHLNKGRTQSSIVNLFHFMIVLYNYFDLFRHSRLYNIMFW